MIRAKTVGGDLVIGLSRSNIRRLKSEHPIVFNLRELGYDADINFVITTTVKGDESIAVMPAEIENKVGVILVYETLEDLFKREVEITWPDFKIRIFAEETQEELERSIYDGGPFSRN